MSPPVAEVYRLVFHTPVGTLYSEPREWTTQREVALHVQAVIATPGLGEWLHGAQDLRDGEWL